MWTVKKKKWGGGEYNFLYMAFVSNFASGY